MVDSGFFLHFGQPGRMVLANGLIGAIGPDDDFTHEKEQAIKLRGKASKLEESEVMGLAGCGARKVKDQLVLGDDELKLTTVALFFPE